MRRAVIFTTVWAAAALAVIFGFILSADKNGGFENMSVLNSAILLKQQEFTADNTDSVEIDVLYQNIEFITGGTDKFHILQYGAENTAPEDIFTGAQNGSSLIINTGGHNMKLVNFGAMTRGKLVVKTPQSFSGEVRLNSASGTVSIENSLKLKALNAASISGAVKVYGDIETSGDVLLKSVSGSIKLEGNVKAENLHMETTSGSITAENLLLTAKELRMETTSGGIKTQNEIIAEALYAKSVSGSIKLGKTRANNLYLAASSGSIRADDGLWGSGDIKTNSGTISAYLLKGESRGSLTAKTSSGGIKFKTPYDLKFRLDAKTTSGGIRTNLPESDGKNKERIIISGNADALDTDITASSVSGSIRIDRED